MKNAFFLNLLQFLRELCPSDALKWKWTGTHRNCVVGGGKLPPPGREFSSRRKIAPLPPPDHEFYSWPVSVNSFLSSHTYFFRTRSLVTPRVYRTGWHQPQWRHCLNGIWLVLNIQYFCHRPSHIWVGLPAATHRCAPDDQVGRASHPQHELRLPFRARSSARPPGGWNEDLRRPLHGWSPVQRAETSLEQPRAPIMGQRV